MFIYFQLKVIMESHIKTWNYILDLFLHYCFKSTSNTISQSKFYHLLCAKFNIALKNFIKRRQFVLVFLYFPVLLIFKIKYLLVITSFHFLRSDIFLVALYHTSYEKHEMIEYSIEISLLYSHKVISVSKRFLIFLK